MYKGFQRSTVIKLVAFFLVIGEGGPHGNQKTEKKNIRDDASGVD